MGCAGRRGRLFEAWREGSEGRRQLPPEFEENSVGPAEANDVLSVAGTDMRDFGGPDDIIFFADGAVDCEVSQDGVEEFAGNAASLCGEAVAAQAFDSE